MSPKNLDLNHQLHISAYSHDLQSIDPLGITLRPWSDNLITTSLVYFLPSIYGLAVGERHMAFLCAITCFGSTIYHRNREAMYFNLDNVFATSLLVSYCWSLYLAYGIYDIYFYFGLLGIPVAIFLLVYCGMPADIHILKETLSTPFCCVRSDRPLYNSVHALWHLASGFGPLLSVWLFSCCAREYNIQQSLLEISERETIVMVMGSIASIDGYGYMPLVPTVALLMGVILNFTGNCLEVMPMK